MSDYLREEALGDILTRLPVKSILRFKSTCKHWQTLISDPLFVKTHINRQNPTHKLIARHFRAYEEKYTLLDDHPRIPGPHIDLHFPCKGRSTYFTIVGACNGLICLSDQFLSHDYGIILWNPSIKKFITLFSHCMGMHYASVGFGFDAKSNDFKVVMIHHGWDIDVKVFSLSSGFWRRVKAAGGGGYGMYSRNKYFGGANAFVNGAIHWMGYDRRIGYEKNCLIVSFDMGHEVLRELMLPDNLVCDWRDLALMRYKDLISVLYYEKHGKERFCSIWVMKEYGVVGSWAKLFKIRLGGKLFLHKVIGFRENGDVLVGSKFDGIVCPKTCNFYSCKSVPWKTKGSKSGRLYLYDFRTGKMRDLEMSGDLDLLYVDTYVESLVLWRHNDII